jgi:phosphoenolpyruvate carboxylase
MISGWFGAGAALAALERELGGELIGELYSRWFFFENLIDDVELALARADMEIAKFYDSLAQAKHEPIVRALRDEYALAQAHVQKIKGCARLLDGEPTLQRSIRLRNPYLDPMHLMQVDLLQRWRAGGRNDNELLAALLASVSGIASGLQGSA